MGSKDDATQVENIARRRAQNRLAQRRFRERNHPDKSAFRTQLDLQLLPEADIRLLLPTQPQPQPQPQDSAQAPPTGDNGDSSSSPERVTSPSVLDMLDDNAMYEGLNIASLNHYLWPDLLDSNPGSVDAEHHSRIHDMTEPQEEQRKIHSHTSSTASRSSSQRSAHAGGEYMALEVAPEASCPPPAAAVAAAAAAGSVADLWGPTLKPPQQAFTASDGWHGPLHIAAQKGNDRILRLLIQRNPDCNEKDSDGMTPLMLAVVGGYEDIAGTLLRHGARVGEADGQNRSALHLAVSYRRERVLQLLVEHCGGDRTVINSYDVSGRTPLHLAIDVGFEAGVAILLSSGADVCAKASKFSQHSTI